MKIQDQVVLITGGARGLGKAITQAFAAEGARVVINYYQSEDAAKALAQEIGERAVALQADVRDAGAVAAMLRQAEVYHKAPVTTLVNNALINYRFDPSQNTQYEALAWENMEAQLTGTLKGAHHCIQACLPSMKAAKFGRIIQIGTNLFHNPVVPYYDYTTAKAALLGFSRNLARELGAHNITVNMLSGGLLRTTDASAATSDAVFDIIQANTPLQRVTSLKNWPMPACFLHLPGHAPSPVRT
ncbi:3-ketoacyl-(acyl-carrier-protein) reductase [Nitritalea halalkaliphila LW7]|uniref:3-ketoacyl-(Acyl-carrier-protein) reductase n=1 Tax=Nitritalea halalkaliphila LW7 TaxID=1189621 RepID=I5BWS7_9BACT|nr:3-oxoacyl-ACP reductase [Nitritalea halalkaliphila]EIM74029.1 3-ketoacyl-(acyl-carrier-protein) reductase [Nitritalea halalkaliphila LW7]